MTPVAKFIENLSAALAGRGDHAAWCGLTTKPVFDGLRIGWQDSLKRQEGLVGIVPHWESRLDLLSSLVEFITDWKAAAAEVPQPPARKERKSADRARCVRSMDPDAHHRSLAR